MSAQTAVPGVRERIAAFGRALTAPEVAGVFGVSEQMVYKQARSGTIPAFRIGTALRFDPQKLIDWYELQ